MKLKVVEGYLTKVEVDEEDNESISKIGRAIIPKKYMINMDTGQVQIEIEFEDNNRTITKTISRADINKNKLPELTAYGADCWGEIANHYVTYLRYKMNEIDRIYQHEDVGWGVIGNKKIFKHYRAIGVNSQYISHKYNLEPSGSLDGWLNLVKREALGHKNLELMMAITFTAPLLKILSDYVHMDTLIFNFSGKSSRGKTIGCKFAISAWGYPDTQGNGLVKTWHGTDLGILKEFEGNFGIPLVVDDTSHQNNEKDFTEFIYMLAGNKAKTALKSNGQKREQKEWLTTMFSSSEKDIFSQIDPSKSGAKARLTETKIDYVTESAEHAERIEKGIYQNYGHAGIEFVKNLMEINPRDIFTYWQDTKRELEEKIQGDFLSQRIIGKLAIVQMAGELANEFLDMGLDIEMLSNTLVEIETSSVERRDNSDKAYHSLLEYFMTRQQKFFKNKTDLKWKKGDVIGKYSERSDGKVATILIPKNNFNRIAKQLRFDPSHVIPIWKDRGYLLTDKQKNTISRVFKPGMPRITMYGIKVKKDIVVGETDSEQEKSSPGLKIVAEEKETYSAPKKSNKELIMEKADNDESIVSIENELLSIPEEILLEEAL